MNCPMCGYIAKTQDEIQNVDIWGCCRALVKKSGSSMTIELCSINRTEGGFYAPGTAPETIVEDPDALKDGFIKIDEQKVKAKEKLREELSKPEKPRK